MAHPHPWDMLGLQTATKGKSRATKQKQVQKGKLYHPVERKCVLLSLLQSLTNISTNISILNHY
jgi:hypothetical protein